MSHVRAYAWLLAALAVFACSPPVPESGAEEEIPQPGVLGQWQWVSFQSMDDSSIEITDPSLYTLEMQTDGVSVRADCKRGTGGFELEGSSLTFTDLATTTMACPPESLGDRYLSYLGYVRSWLIENGHLYLSLYADGGIMRFRPAGDSL